MVSMPPSICISPRGPKRCGPVTRSPPPPAAPAFSRWDSRLWPANERDASPTTTAVRIPAGLEDAALRAAARARYGVVFSSGRGETLGKLLRIGHMGPTARPLYAVIALAALGGAIRAAGHALDVGAGMAAALAVIDKGIE